MRCIQDIDQLSSGLPYLATDVVNAEGIRLEAVVSCHFSVLWNYLLWPAMATAMNQ
jgi:hypothetical protein